MVIGMRHTAPHKGACVPAGVPRSSLRAARARPKSAAAARWIAARRTHGRSTPAKTREDRSEPTEGAPSRLVAATALPWAGVVGRSGAWSALRITLSAQTAGLRNAAAASKYSAECRFPCAAPAAILASAAAADKPSLRGQKARPLRLAARRRPSNRK